MDERLRFVARLLEGEAMSLRDLKLINSHIVAASAYPVLERTGELLPSRRAANTSEEG